MYRVCIFVGVLLVIASAQIPSLGYCPDYLPMAEFDMEQFLGKWYEAERYFQLTELASRCVVTDYARAPSGKIYVSNEVTNRITGIKRIIDGQIDLPGKAGDGKMKVKYSTAPLSSESMLTVLDTDYDTYAVVWSCSGLGPLHAENAWVMTRERIPAGPVMQKAYGVLDKYKISRTFFVKTDQEGCAIAASDINAANGIASVSTVAEAFGHDQRRIPLLEKEKTKSDSVEQNEENNTTSNNPVEVSSSSQVNKVSDDKVASSLDLCDSNCDQVKDSPIPSPPAKHAAVAVLSSKSPSQPTPSAHTPTKSKISPSSDAHLASSEEQKGLSTTEVASSTSVTANVADEKTSVVIGDSEKPVALEPINSKPQKVAEMILENANKLEK